MELVVEMQHGQHQLHGWVLNQPGVMVVLVNQLLFHFITTGQLIGDKELAGKVKMFNKNWFIKNQRLLRWFANTSYGKDILGYGLDRVDFILPNAVFQKQGKQIKAEFRTHDKYSKRMFYAYRPIWKAFHWFDMNIANVYIPKLNLGFDNTFYSNAGGDGGILYTDNDYATAHNASSGEELDNTEAYGRLAENEISGISYYINRAFFPFDTSAIGDSDTIISAIFSFYSGTKRSGAGDSLAVVLSTQASNTNLILEDYDQLGTTVGSNLLTTEDVVVGQYNNLTLNSTGRGWISKTGYTSLGVRMKKDIDNVTPTTLESIVYSYYADETGTSNDPKLVVIYPASAIFFGTNI